MKMRSRFSAVLLCCLLTVCESGPSTVVSIVGENVTLTCTYNIITHGPLWACWSRGALSSSGCSNQIVETDGISVTQESGKYRLLGRLDEGDISLTILDVKKEDAGEYGCRVQVLGLFNDQKQSIKMIIKDAHQATTLKTDVSTARIASIGNAAQMTSTEGLQTSSSLIGVKTKYKKQDVPWSMILMGILFGLIVFVAVIIGIIGTRRRITKIHHQHPAVPVVLFSSVSSSLDLHHQAAAVDNIYQMDTNEYDYLP